MGRRVAILAVLLVQSLCTLFFLSDILSSHFSLWPGPMSWKMRELMELGAAFGLLIGVVLGVLLFWRTLQERNLAQERLRRASVAFMDLLAERFAEWGLTRAERDVALFAIKGMSTAEIAALRATSEGTVKAQTAAIYRKAGVSGRPQLLSLFIDDLMREDVGVRPVASVAATSQSVA